MQQPDKATLDFKTLFEAAPGCYLVLAPDFTIVAVSNSYLDVTKTKREQILGKHLFEVFPDNPDDPSASGVSNLKSSLDRVLESKAQDIMAIQKYDIRLPDSEGGGFIEKYWSPINFPVFDHNKNVSHIIHRVEDVTEFVRLKQLGVEQHKLTEELKSRTDQLEKLRQSQRMEAMGQLAGGVAHDFNNILSVIIMNCEIALNNSRIPEEIKKNCNEIKRTSERAASLTRQLLAFSRKQVLQPKPLNANSMIYDMGSLLERLLTENINLKTKLASDLKLTLVDPGQIEQIILNLVVNARDAISKNGDIIIETANAYLDKAMACGNPKVEPGEYIMIAVRDSGIGMDAETQARLFEPFFTTKGIGKGTGLGLATVYGIVSQNHGTIWVYSEVGKGTVFKIYLPVVNDIAEKIIQHETKPVLPNESANILVVEDQEELRAPVCEILRSKGYTVFEANNGLRALSIVNERPNFFHLVITDVIMPEMDGRVLAEKLSKVCPNVKIIYLSGYTEDTLVNYGLSEKHPHFLEKPFTSNSLLKKVYDVLLKD